MAERGAGSWEGFFALEATGSLDTIERLRAELAHAPEGASRIAERLTYSFRQLRERAVTFGHTGLGRVARRAGAAVRASRDQPPWRLQAIAVDLAVTIAALRSYLEASEKGVRDSALRRAEDSLEAATHPTRGPTVEIETLLYSAEDAIARARSLSGELAGLLRVETIDFGRAQHLLDEALGLIEHALVQTATAQ
jgi:hypothetical protein